MWTYKCRAACVISTRQQGQPLTDAAKLGRLKRIMHSVMAAGGQNAVVSVDQVGGWIALGVEGEQ